MEDMVEYDKSDSDTTSIVDIDDVGRYLVPVNGQKMEYVIWII